MRMQPPPDVTAAHDAHRAFPVTDPELDAPDGAIVDGYERSGDRWEALATVPEAAGAVTAALAEGDALVRSYLATLGSPRSVSTMTESFARVASALGVPHYSEIPWAKLDLDALALIRHQLDQTHRPATTNLTLSAVRGVLGEAADRGLITEQFLGAARRRLKGVRGSRIPKGRALSNDEIGHLRVTAAMFDEPKASMMLAILMLALGTGLRREELCTLTLDSTATADAGELRVVGKGDKERSCPLDEPTQQHLLRWVEVRRAIDWPHRMLFASPSHGKPLSKQTLWWLIRELAGAAEVKSFSPHDLRRTFATRMLGAHLDLREVQVLMGHARPETTARYDKRSVESLAERRRAVRVFEEDES